MSKKILIPLIIIVVAALLAAAAYFVVIPRIKAGQSNVNANQEMSSNTEQVSQSSNSDGNASASGQDTLTTGSTINASNIVSDPNYMMFDNEQNFVENFALGIFDSSKEQEVYEVLSSDIPTMFDIDTNAIKKIQQAQSISSFYELGVFTDAQINHCSLAKVVNDQYDRHVAMVTAQNGNISESYQINIVVDLLNHSVVFFNMNRIAPVHSEIVESEYEYLESRLYVNDGDVEEGTEETTVSESPLVGDNYIKGTLIALYSYSPFIEKAYWRTVSDHYRFSSDNSSIRVDDIAYRLFMDWRPTFDGAALTVESIGQPTLINSSGNSAYYECPIAYRTNHGGNAQDTYTTATLHFYIDLDSMQITSLTEDNVSKAVIDPVNAGQAQTPSIKSLVGVSQAG